MKRLLWKEFSERYWWALAWVASILGVSLFAHGQAFCGQRYLYPSSWHLLPLAMALLVGVGMYAGETARDRAIFVFSRPIPGRRMLLAKLLFGVIIIVGVPLLAVAIFRVTCPEPYRQFVTLPHVLEGACAVMWPMGALYMFGMACSTVLAGLTGGMLTLATVILILITGLLIALGGFDFYRDIHLLALSIGIPTGLWLATVVAGLSLTRAELAPDVDERIKRFVVIFVPLLLISWLFSSLFPQRLAGRLLLHWETSDVRVSPGGTYAVVGQDRRPRTLNYLFPLDYYDNYGWTIDVIRMADLQRIPNVTTTRMYYWRWLTDDAALASDGNGLVIYHIGKQENIQIDKSGHFNFDGASSISPDGRYAVSRFNRSNKKQLIKEFLQILNLQSGKITEMALPEGKHYKLVWWQSNTEIGYLDEMKQRHIVRVPVE